MGAGGSISYYDLHADKNTDNIQQLSAVIRSKRNRRINTLKNRKVGRSIRHTSKLTVTSTLNFFRYVLKIDLKSFSSIFSYIFFFSRSFRRKTRASRNTGPKGSNSFARNNRLQITDDHMKKLRLKVSANNK